MTIAWSPTFTNEDFPQRFEDWTLEDKVKLFESQVLGWQLQIANNIINVHGRENPHAGFAILSILLNYFEMIGKYIRGYTGNGESYRHFKIGMLDVFPDLRDRNIVLRTLYGDARCGMYHEALIGKRILLTRRYDAPIHVIDEELPIVAIDPHSLTTRLIEHFNDYIQQLRSSDMTSQILSNFVMRFDFLKRSKVRLQRNLSILDSGLFS